MRRTTSDIGANASARLAGMIGGGVMGMVWGAVWLGPTAAAEIGPPAVEHGVSATILATTADADGGPTVQQLSARLDADLRIGWITESGIEFGVEGAVAAETDQRRRDIVGGRFGNCPAGIGDCLALISPWSGVSTAGAQADSGPRLSLERAFVFGRTGFADVAIGRDQGVGARYAPAPPSLTRGVSAGDSALDPGGLDTVRTANDPTGPAAKLSVESVRLLGVRLGASFTPEADVRGLDAGAFSPRAGSASVHLRNVREVAINFARPLAGTDVIAGVTWSQADTETSAAVPIGVTSETAESWSAGLSVGREAWGIGVRVLSADPGIAHQRPYRAWRVGTRLDALGWIWGLEGGHSTDALVHTTSSVWQIGAARDLGHARLALGWRDTRLEAPEATPAGRRGRTIEASGVFIETHLAF